MHWSTCRKRIVDEEGIPVQLAAGFRILIDQADNTLEVVGSGGEIYYFRTPGQERGDNKILLPAFDPWRPTIELLIALMLASAGLDADEPKIGAVGRLIYTVKDPW